MAMGSNYDRFLKLLKIWPVDVSKGNRDYGSYLRELLRNSKKLEEIFPGNAEENSEMISALFRLSDDKYNKKYDCRKKVGAAGLEVEYLKIAVSNELIKESKSK